MNLRILSLGAGVQSTTLAYMACRGELHVDHIIFADTGDETFATYEHLARLEKHINEASILFHRVESKFGSDIKKAILESRNDRDKGSSVGQPPVHVIKADGDNARIGRKCTRDFKIDPIIKKSRELLGVGKGERVPKGRMVTRLIGISMDEVHRMKPSRHKWEVTEWPLIDLGMTRWDCYIWLKKHGYTIPPRSSCRICPNHDNAYWRDLRDNHLEDWRIAVEFDRALRADGKRLPGVKGEPYLHRLCVPLDQVDLTTDADRGQKELDLWGGECEGICGT